MLKKLALVPKLLAALAAIVVLGFGAHQAIATARPAAADCVCQWGDPDADEFCSQCCGSASQCSVGNICVCG